MTQVGTVYGEALYDLAGSEGLDQEILQQLRFWTKLFVRNRIICGCWHPPI